MSLMHCPLCLGLAVVSVLRAGAHLSLVLLSLPPQQHPKRTSTFAPVGV